MTAHVFTGPTLPASEARLELEAVYHPPIAEGDILRLLALQPDGQPEMIGIIDGYFERVPAV